MIEALNILQNKTTVAQFLKAVFFTIIEIDPQKKDVEFLYKLNFNLSTLTLYPWLR